MRNDRAWLYGHGKGEHKPRERVFLCDEHGPFDAVPEGAEMDGRRLSPEERLQNLLNPRVLVVASCPECNRMMPQIAEDEFNG